MTASQGFILNLTEKFSSLFLGHSGFSEILFPRLLEMLFLRLWKTLFQGSLENRFPKLFTKAPDKQQEQQQQQASKSFLRPRYTTILAVKNLYYVLTSVFFVVIIAIISLQNLA